MFQSYICWFIDMGAALCACGEVVVLYYLLKQKAAVSRKKSSSPDHIAFPSTNVQLFRPSPSTNKSGSLYYTSGVIYYVR